MDTPDRLAIVGTSLAANRLLRTLRRKGWDGTPVLIGAEEHLPYDRPPLSKQFLAGTTERAGIDLGPDDVYDGAELHLGVEAVRLVPSERRVELADGHSVTADHVVIATGSHARRLPDQPELQGVVTLRTVEDALALRACLDRASRIVVVGAGFIGSEVASTARGLGVEVTVLEADVAPVVRGVGPVVGRALATLHHRAGVDLRLGVTVDGIVGDGSRVTGVALGDGTVVDADAVLVAIGAVPTTDWLDGSGLRLDNGVVTDDRCRAVGGDGHVWAVGDVARWPSRRYDQLLRVEHWTNAMDHALAVTANLLGGDEVFDPIPYVWSDQFGQKIQSLGVVRGDDEVEIVVGDLDDDTWVAAFLRDGRLAGVVGLDQPRTVMQTRGLIQAGASLDVLRAHLASP